MLATNTSTLDVDEIASATRRPESVIGMHFFSPANVMRLLENVRGDKSRRRRRSPPPWRWAGASARCRCSSASATASSATACCTSAGSQAEKLILEGALPHQVDKVLTDFGFPMGPFAMGDLAGLDVGWRIRKGRGVTSPVADRICELGRFGQKTGAGYFRYDKGDRTPSPDPDVEKIIVEVSAEMGITRRHDLGRGDPAAPALPDGERGRQDPRGEDRHPGERHRRDLGVRLRLAGVPRRPDVLGRPIGLKAVRDRMLEWERQTGDAFWTPAPLLDRLADAGKGFLGVVAEREGLRPLPRGTALAGK